MTRVAILGATGYAARELIQLLLRHPQAKITALTTRQTDCPHLDDVHPSLRGRLDLVLENLSPAEVAERADCVFCCLPHAASAAVVSDLMDANCRVVDFSADYRLNDADVYAEWYGGTHPDPQRLGKVPYGLPELYRDSIVDAQLVANPGCYPTAAILALAPLLKAGLIAAEGIAIDAKSGVSGAGRSAKPHLHFPEANEALVPYGVGQHRHTPEIDQVLTDWGGDPTDVVFTPHLVPMDRGELITAYAQPGPTDPQTDDLLAVLDDFYKDEQFVRVIQGLPNTKYVAGTNYCDITARRVRGKVVAIAAIDNLIKGAAGAAVQNFNLMHGYDEATGL